MARKVTDKHLTSLFARWVKSREVKRAGLSGVKLVSTPDPANCGLQFTKEGVPFYILVKRQNLARWMSNFSMDLENLQSAPGSMICEVRSRNQCDRCDFVHMCRSARPQRIALPPGMWLDRGTRFLLTREAHRRFVEPVIADMRLEYFDALAAGYPWHARWIAARVYFVVIPGYLYGFIARAVKRVFSA